MTSWILTKTVTHKRMRDPVIQSVEIRGELEEIIKRKIKADGHVLYQLRKFRRADYTDRRGAQIHLELTPKIEAPLIRRSPWAWLKVQAYLACLKAAAFLRRGLIPRGFR